MVHLRTRSLYRPFPTMSKAQIDSLKMPAYSDKLSTDAIMDRMGSLDERREAKLRKDVPIAKQNEAAWDIEKAIYKMMAECGSSSDDNTAVQGDAHRGAQRRRDLPRHPRRVPGRVQEDGPSPRRKALFDSSALRPADADHAEEELQRQGRGRPARRRAQPDGHRAGPARRPASPSWSTPSRTPPRIRTARESRCRSILPSPPRREITPEPSERTRHETTVHVGPHRGSRRGLAAGRLPRLPRTPRPPRRPRRTHRASRPGWPRWSSSSRPTGIGGSTASRSTPRPKRPSRPSSSSPETSTFSAACWPIRPPIPTACMSPPGCSASLPIPGLIPFSPPCRPSRRSARRSPTFTRTSPRWTSTSSSSSRNPPTRARPPWPP